jgi:tetratricopeptide (TPR) repeat protein
VLESRCFTKINVDYGVAVKLADEKIKNRASIPSSNGVSLNESSQSIQKLEGADINSTIAQARQLYGRIVELNAANKLLECKIELEKSLKLYPDYQDAVNFLGRIDKKISDCEKDMAEAKKIFASKKYKQAIILIESIMQQYDAEELKGLYDAVVTKERRARKYRLISLIVSLPITLIIISIFTIKIYSHYMDYSSYMEKAYLAFSNKEYDKVIELYDEALKVPGYHNDLSAKKFKQEAQLELERKTKFDKLIAEGRECLKRKDWASAEESVRAAISIPGYEKNSTAASCLKMRQEGLESQRKQ